jgi:hypothetical protein
VVSTNSIRECRFAGVCWWPTQGLHMKAADTRRLECIRGPVSLAFNSPPPDSRREPVEHAPNRFFFSSAAAGEIRCFLVRGFDFGLQSAVVAYMATMTCLTVFMGVFGGIIAAAYVADVYHPEPAWARGPEDDRWRRRAVCLPPPNDEGWRGARVSAAACGTPLVVGARVALHQPDGVGLRGA